MKAKLVLFFWVLLALVLLGCEIPNVYDNPDAIINNSDKSSLVGSVLVNFGNTYNHRVSKFNGMKTIRTINKSGELKFEIDLVISSGRYKLVLVKDNQIIPVTDENTNGVISFNYLEDGRYKLKMIGDEAAFDLKLKIMK